MSLLSDMRAILPLKAQTRCRPVTALEAEIQQRLSEKKATREIYSAVQLRRSQ